jgi:glycosyltransferase involved in cell wall biosynthesis
MRIHISILVATFNGERFLPELLLSLAHQTYQPLEIVFCDDGSTDQTISILEEFARTRPINSKVVRNQKNKGYARNFSEGLNLCQGDYVAFCDQDDVWKKNKLERLATRIKPDLTPSMVFSDCELVDSELKPLNQTAIGFSGISESQKEQIFNGDLLKVLLQHPLIPGMCMLVNRERTLKNLPIPTGLMHDYAISAGFSKGADYSFVDECLVLYRQHSQNSIGMTKRSNTRKAFFRGPIYGRNYSVEVNADLDSGLKLQQYISSFVSVPSDKAQEHQSILIQSISLKLLRLKRRFRLKHLFWPSNLPLATWMTKKERRRIWLKDFRSNVRLKINRCFLHLQGGALD